MWFFVDESWCPDNHAPKFGVLAGVLLRQDDLMKYDNLLYGVRKKYFGGNTPRICARN